MRLLHGRVGRVLALALTIAWLATIACADAQSEMHRHHMHYCPRDAGSPGCSTAQCAVQVPEKKEAKSDEHVVNVTRTDAVSADWLVTPRAERLRELTSGLRFRAAVFRLKDDLRI